jgi:ribosome maturation factor RimP
MTLIESIEKLIKPPILSLGFTLYEVSLTLEQGEKYLRVLIEKKGARIGLQDIVDVSRLINPLLDEASLMNEHYILDVASAGAEHPIHLDELENYLDRNLYLHLIHPFNGENMITGRLTKLEPDRLWMTIQVKSKTQTIEIKRKDIDYARLAVAMK